MIAKVKDSPPATLTRRPGSHRSLNNRKALGGKAPSSPTLAAAPTPQGVNITYDPTAAPASQFTFANTTHSDLQGNRYLPVPPEGAQITLGLITQNGNPEAIFSSSPLNWLNNPNPGGPPPNLTTFTVAQPADYLTPWVFTVNVNYGGVNNIMSPPFYLVKAPPETVELILNYDSGTGSFQLTSNGSTAIPQVAYQEILLNVLPAKYQITLQGATFNTNPIVWASGTPLVNGWPAWITPLPSAPGLDATKTVLTFSIPGPISGQSAGFQFAVDVNGVTVLSPDPIIINATIGDG